MIASGTVIAVRPQRLEAAIRGVACAERVTISSDTGQVRGVIVEATGRTAIIEPFAGTSGIRVGDNVRAQERMRARLGTVLLGRAVDGFGNALDGRAVDETRLQYDCAAPPPRERAEICEPCWTGVRAIDALLTIGRGARIGIFGEPGIGKSTLLEMLVGHNSADAVVVGLTGERGREAERWIATIMPRTAVVCATSDTSAQERMHAARFAMDQACALRASGLHVLLILDSLARYAAALREAAIASNEPAGRGGYPPSVFRELAKYVECAGATHSGSVTMIATVLSDGDERDPVSDAARSLLDGHVQLSPSLARAGHFPAIDVPASTSRTMSAVTSHEHLQAASSVRAALAELQRIADVRAAGIAPADVRSLRVIAAETELETFLRQARTGTSPAASLAELAALADTLEEAPWISPPTSPP